MFNKLTDQQMERFNLLSEQLGSVQKAIGKIMLHGMESRNPTQPYSIRNDEQLEHDIAGMMCAINFICRAGDLSIARMTQQSIEREKMLSPYLHHHADIPF